MASIDNPMTSSAAVPTLENLSRLASKPGVQFTLVLSKTDGSIIRSSSHSVSPGTSKLSASGSGKGAGDERMNNVMNYETEPAESATQTNVEDVARMVFSFVSAAGALVEDMDSEDDLKLLRLRTRKNEIIIVPEAKFLMVAILSAPGA